MSAPKPMHLAVIDAETVDDIIDTTRRPQMVDVASQMVAAGAIQLAAQRTLQHSLLERRMAEMRVYAQRAKSGATHEERALAASYLVELVLGVPR